MALNKVMLIGNVGADPEVRYLSQNNINDNNRVARVRLATTERYKDRQSGEYKEMTEWHTVNVWGKAAEVVEKYVKKGTQLYVEGSLRTREYESNGQKRYSTEVRADNIQLLGRRGDGEGSAAAPAPARTPAPAAAPEPVPDPHAVMNDDLPF